MASLPSSVDASYSGYRLLIFTAIWIPVLIICVALRYFARWVIKGPWRLDDALIFLSLFLQLGLAGVSIASLKYAGVGRHVQYLEATDPNKLTVWGQYLVTISLVYLAGVNIPKLAILALYYRLFPINEIRLGVRILVAVLIMLTLSLLITDFAACRPFAANWDQTIPATCINKEDFFRWSSIPNIFSDIAILVLPMRVVWNLQAKRRMKIGVTVTFTVGSFGLITSVVRFTTFFRKNSFVDGTWSAIDLIIWTQIEPGVYLICACLPTWRPLLERAGKNFFGKVMNRKTRSSTKPSNVASNEGSDIQLRSNSSKKGQGFQRLEDRNHRSTQSIHDIMVTKGFSIMEQTGEGEDLERLREAARGNDFN